MKKLNDHLYEAVCSMENRVIDIDRNTLIGEIYDQLKTTNGYSQGYSASTESAIFELTDRLFRLKIKLDVSDLKRILELLNKVI